MCVASWVAFATVFICLIVMACCGNVRRQAPMNFIFLGIFTVAESFLLGVTSSVYAVDAVSLIPLIFNNLCNIQWDLRVRTDMDYKGLVEHGPPLLLLKKN